MTEPSPRFWEIFFEVYEALPRQGPGDRVCAERALGLCAGLPEAPAVLDLGCGVGAQTLHLAELTAGSIVAVDLHAPWIDHLTRVVAERGLADRVRPVVGDMAALRFAPASFDLVWSEGALYNLGLPRALALCRDLLRPGGHLAFTEAMWLTTDPPAAVRASFDFDYPTMGDLAAARAAVAEAGLTLLGDFTLPDSAWWDAFYTPMEARVAELQRRYAGDPEALAVLAVLAQEPELYRRHGDCFAYAFLVARREA